MAALTANEGRGAFIDLLKKELDRNIQSDKLRIQGAKLRQDTLRNSQKNALGRQTDVADIRASLGRLISTGPQGGTGAPPVIASGISPARTDKAAAGTGNPMGGGVANILSDELLGFEKSVTSQGAPSPTGRQGEVSREATTTTTSSGGGGVRGLGVTILGKLIGAAIDTVTPGEGNKVSNFFSNLGTQTSESTRVTTNITQEHRDDMEGASSILAVSAGRVLDGAKPADQHKKLMQGVLGEFTEESDRAEIRADAQRGAIQYRQVRQATREEAANKIASTAALKGVEIPPAIVKGLASSNAGTRTSALGQLAKNHRDSPAGQAEENDRKRAEVELSSARIALDDNRSKSIHNRVLRRATVADLRRVGEIAAAELPTPPEGYNVAHESRKWSALVAAASSSEDPETVRENLASLTGPGKLFPFISSMTGGSPSVFMGFGGEDPIPYTDASILKSAQFMGDFRLHQLYMVPSGRPPVVYSGDLGKTRLGSVDGPKVREALDMLAGNRPLDKDFQNITDGKEEGVGEYSPEATRKAQEHSAQYLRGITLNKEGKEELTDMEVAGLGFVVELENDGSYAVNLNKDPDISLNPELAKAYLTMTDYKNVAEETTGTRYFDSSYFKPLR